MNGHSALVGISPLKVPSLLYVCTLGSWSVLVFLQELHILLMLEWQKDARYSARGERLGIVMASLGCRETRRTA
ncbi:hypothetical protein VTH06DRAFT_4448 [Thermothelomyces fergusii]